MFLGNLTPGRAFFLFCFALATGVILIVLNLGGWLAMIPVVAYGVLLFVSQAFFEVSLDETVKDSPYFLGFLLTLSAIFKALGLASGLSSVSATLGTSSGHQSSLLLAAGEAILPTLAGLFMRQALLSRDPAEDVRQAVFQSLAQELKEHSSAFVGSQRQLVRLIDDFVSTRREQFGAEERAIAAYVAGLEKSTDVLGELGATVASDVKDIHRQLVDSAASLRQTLDESISTTAAATKRLASSIEEGIGGAVVSLKTGTSSVSEHLHSMVGGLASAHHELNSLTSGLAKYNEGLQSIGTAASASSAELSKLPEKLSALTAEATSGLKESLTQVNKGNAEVAEKIQRISSDLTELDHVFEELVQLLIKRMKAVASS